MAESATFKEEGAQLFSDILTFNQNGGKGVRWILDETTTAADKALFKKTIMDALEYNRELRLEVMNALSTRQKIFTAPDLDNWIDAFDRNFEKFSEVIQK